MKDYSATISNVILAAKSSQLHFIADSVEVLWKFLLVSLDRLTAVKQRQLEHMFNEDMTEMNNKVKFLSENLKESEKRFQDMSVQYDNKIKGLIHKNTELGNTITDLRSELVKLKIVGSDTGPRENRDTLLGRFEQMTSDIKTMSNKISEATELNHEQNKLVRKDLLTSIMGLFNKGFKCNSKSVSTQTDLSMCSMSQIVYKYGIEETVMPESKIIAAFRHPFLPFLFQTSDSMKPRMEEQIDFIERNLDSSSYS